MFHFATSELTHFLTVYGYWAVLLFVAIESAGIPLPGETMLLVASIYAGTTHRLAIPLVIASAALGAIVGDNLGYWVGREGGYRLLRRYGRYIRIDERRLKLGQYLFRKYGGKVVFFGRFIAILRVWAAFLAGTNRMPWPPFLFYNAQGGITWATIYGLGVMFSAIVWNGWRDLSDLLRSRWGCSSLSHLWSMCDATSDAWRRKRRKLFLVHLMRPRLRPELLKIRNKRHSFAVTPGRLIGRGALR